MAGVLGVSTAHAYALVRSGEVPAIKVGGRGQWRIEAAVLEDAIRKMYAETAQFVHDHPFGGNTGDPGGPDVPDEPEID